MISSETKNGTNGHYNNVNKTPKKSSFQTPIRTSNSNYTMNRSTPYSSTKRPPSSTLGMSTPGSSYLSSTSAQQRQGATPNNSKKPLSYESFAPRSQNQRNRLAKLQALTAGPIPMSAPSSSNATPGTASSSSKSSAATSKTVFVKAMIPDQTLDASSSNKNGSGSSSSSSSRSWKENITPNGEKGNSDNDFITQILQQTHITSEHITQILTSSNQLSKSLSQTISLTQSLTNKHSQLLHQSSELSYNAEKLQSEYDQLMSHANDIGLPLKHYDDVDRLGLLVGVLFKNGVVVKGIARVKVDDDAEFTNVLDCINDAISFFEKRNSVSSNNSMNDDPNLSSNSGSMEYYRRSVVLQEAALDLLKEAIVNRIDTTTSQIMNALQLNNIKKAINGDVLEASLVYTRFHGISSRSCHLMNMIYKRMNVVYVPNPNVSEAARRRKKKQQQQQNGTAGSLESQSNGVNDDFVCAYTELWTLCRNSYIANRTQLLKLSIRSHLDFLKDKHGLIGMTRLASVFLMRLCTIETSLYLDFFGREEEHEGENGNKESKENGEGNHVLNGTANGKKEKVSIGSSSTKSSSSSSLTSKKKNRDAATLASQVMSKDGTYYDAEFQTFLDTLCDNLHRTIRRGLVSVLDLDTLCQIVSVLREERSLANSSPTTMAAARSIGKVIEDAQERLIFCANSALGKEVIRFKATPSDLDYPDKLRTWREQQDNQKDGTGGSESHKESKEEEALKLQMQVYESWFPPIRSVLKVLSKIFRVVEPNVFEDIALTSIQSCSRSLKEGSMYIEKKSGVLNSDLFLVKNLLILREQLSPFDMQLRSVERQLDFSDAGKAVSRFIANRNRRLFSMTSENALVTLLSEGMSTREKSIDSKRDLEDSLRSACNDFIEHTSVSLAGPVVTFVEQCKSASSAAAGAPTDAPLKSQSFMTGEYVLTVMTRALDRLEPEIGEITCQMSLYMESAATRSILLKPVVRKITRLLDESRTFIEEGAVVDDSERWTDQQKIEVKKVMDAFEKVIKSNALRS